MSRKQIRAALTIGTLLFSFGCASGRLAEPSGDLVADPEQYARQIGASTIPNSPQQVNFSWTLEEGGSRVRGEGVARVDAPERARLDLFGPRGESYLSAALVEGEYRLPQATAGAVTLPSPTLLWSALGVLHPPADATLANATETADGAELRYETPDDQIFVYRFENDENGILRLRRLERATRRGIMEAVSLEWDDETIARAAYRNWTQYRDLILQIESVQGRAAFPSGIWRPDAD